MAEAGFPDMSISFWSAMVAPAGVPPSIVKKLEGELVRQSSSCRTSSERMTAMLQSFPSGRSGEETRRFVENQIAIFAAIAHAANIKRD